MECGFGSSVFTARQHSDPANGGSYGVDLVDGSICPEISLLGRGPQLVSMNEDLAIRGD
jgi:hypothetical protein